MSDIFELNRQEDEACGLPVFRPIRDYKFVEEDISFAWHIKGLIPSSAQVGAIVAPSNIGKSLLAAEMAHCVQAGKPFAGLKTTQGNCALVLGEGIRAFPLRLKALKHKHGELPGVEIVPGPANFLDQISVSQLGKELPAFSLIFIDTMTTNVQFNGEHSSRTGDENSSSYMTVLLENCKYLSRLTGATVVLIHHPGKDINRGARGNYAFYAGLDFELQIEQIGENRARLKLTKARDYATDLTIEYQVLKLVLGTDADGDEITSAYLEFDAPVTTPSKAFKRDEPKGQWQKAVLHTLRRLEWERPGACNVETLLSATLEMFPKATEKPRDRRNDNVNRAIKDLILSGHIIKVSDSAIRLPNNATSATNTTNVANVVDQIPSILTTTTTHSFKSVGGVGDAVGEAIL
jgi:hypothetical protein